MQLEPSPTIKSSTWYGARVRALFVRVHDAMRTTGRMPESITLSELRAPQPAEAFV